MLDQQYP